ncbi:MAG TPA: FAD-dependent thymidylate synthase [Candidatus Ozemobacteraceae bacterium]|nr:FAD-dependent thymidylate synthase [Candidatus Ozemobacteraceae bacterium]
MEVLLLRYTPDPDRIVALAARRCYSARAARAIDDRLSEEECDRLLALLRRRNHLSPYEHASFTFSVDGVSRALSHQLVRHRIASYSQESQRYVDYHNLPQVPCVTPPTIKARPEAKKVFEQVVQATLDAYRRLSELGVPPEDARYIFPNAIETKLVFTLNARSLFNFFEQRCCIKAQWEIRQLADQMLRLVREAAPRIFRNAGSPCRYEKPYCREDDAECKLFPQPREKEKGHDD